MRRLINILLSGLLICIFLNTSNAQVRVDTIDISQTVLEDRHIRYMYNFALNGALFQYQPGAIFFGDYIMANDHKQSKNILILNNRNQVDLEDLELFVESDSSMVVSFVKNNNHIFRQTDFVSQYEIEFIYFETQELKKLKNKLSKKIIEPHKADFAIQFTDFYLIENKIYFTIILYYYLLYEKKIFWANSQLYEFEWCESTHLVYPLSVSKHNFHNIYDMKKGKRGGSVEILSLECHPLER